MSFLINFEILCINCLNIPLLKAKRQYFKIQLESYQQVTFGLIRPKSKLECDLFLFLFLSDNMLHNNKVVLLAVQADTA